MGDGLLPLSPATPGGQIEDVEDLIGAGATPVVRQRVQIAGAILAEIARVMNIDPTGTEYGLVTRSIQPRSSTATVVQVAASLVSVLLLPANPARKQAMFQAAAVSTGGNLYLLFGGSVIPTVELVPGAYYELPTPIFDGDIHGIWDSNIGSVSVTEQT